FAQKEPQKALTAYQRLMTSTDSATRAGALLRAARVQRKLGQLEQSRELYRRLAEIKNANVAGAPAELVARLALCDQGQPCKPVADGLQYARWPLTQGQFEFYSSQSHADPSS